MGIKPKKGLGQHFLRDFAVAQRIALSVDVLAPAQLLEIGPGEGVLTELLLPKYPQLSVIEIDSESVDHLRRAYPSLGERLHYDDFLKWTFPVGHWVIIGNFPYNISSQILFKCLEYRNQIPEIMGMFQKEVAERIASPPGSKSYGVISVLLQAYYDMEYLFTVEPGSFNPPPKVRSGVIRLTRNNVQKLDCDEVWFKRIVKATFNQRRKTIRNGLKSLPKGIFESNHMLLTKRPEQLSVTEFIELTKLYLSHAN